MYLVFFLCSVIAFVFSIKLGRYGKDIVLVDEQAMEAYLPDYKKSLLAAIMVLFVALGLSMLPMVDQKTFHPIEEETERISGYNETEKMYTSDILHIKCKNKSDVPSIWYICVLSIIECIFMFVFLYRLSSEQNKRTKQIHEIQERETVRLEKLRLAKKAEDIAIKKITDLYDRPDVIIQTTDDTSPDWTKTVFFVFSKEVMCYGEKAVMFKDLISCTYVDNSKVETISTGNTSIHISTDTGSLVARSLVGGVIGGEAGVIIGGATASQSGTATTTSTSYSKTKHDYTIIINTKNLNEPLLQIPCGQREQIVHEIVATLNAAIANNQK